MVWPAIISAGAGLIGKLFGGSDNTTSNRVDYEQMVKDAEKAGFNPLTVLRNGGSAGYMQTSHPALSSGAYIADALGQVGSALASVDPMAEASAKLQYEIQQATLENLQADTAARLRASLGGVPVAAGARTVAMGPPLAANAGDPRTPTVETPTVTNPWQDAVIDAAVRDAAAIEERYGDSEIAQALYGAYVGHMDLRANKPGYRKVTDGLLDPNYTLPTPSDFWGLAKSQWNSWANQDYERHRRKFQ